MVQAERERVPGDKILRLRTALSGPLGALGDQLIWAGQVPVLIGIALVGLPWFGGWAVFLAVLIHNVLRIWLTLWGLDLGLHEGLNVGSALQRSWLPRVAASAQQFAALAIGFALPSVAGWLMQTASSREALTVLGVAVVGVGLGFMPWPRFRISGLQFGLILMLITLVVVGGFQ
jgi:mannose/fructose/N-acetylgalactosamine-specific phosphotransferase system component IID